MSLSIDEAKELFAFHLGRVMEERDWQAHELAALIDVTPATVRAWAEGKEFPCPRHLNRVCVISGQTREELLCPF